MNQFGVEAGSNVGRVISSHDVEANLLPANSVFIDHGSAYANPFTLADHGTQDEICDRYELMLAMDQDKLKGLDHLTGKNVITFWADRRNHGETLVELAAMSIDQRLEWAESIKIKNGMGQSLAA